MKRWLFFMAAAVLLFACKKQKAGACTEDLYTFSFAENRKIDTATVTGSGLMFTINPGTKTVFRFDHTGPDCPEISDEEYTESFVFQIPAGQSSFSYSNSQLTTDASLYYRRVCYCFTNNAVPVSSGSISGTKISAGTWRITVNITIPTWNKTFNFSEDFRL